MHTHTHTNALTHLQSGRGVPRLWQSSDTWRQAARELLWNQTLVYHKTHQSMTGNCLHSVYTHRQTDIDTDTNRNRYIDMHRNKKNTDYRLPKTLQYWVVHNKADNPASLHTTHNPHSTNHDSNLFMPSTPHSVSKTLCFQLTIRHIHPYVCCTLFVRSSRCILLPLISWMTWATSIKLTVNI